MSTKVRDSDLPWFVFGERRLADRVPRDDDLVDIADRHGDVWHEVPRSEAERMIYAHNMAIPMEDWD